MEAVILSCLNPDPWQRPDSAYAVAARLPGVDAMSLALAAGETPSPSMVAAANPSGLKFRSSVGWLSVGLLALLLIVLLADRTFLLPQAGLTKAPAVLADKAEDILRALGRDPSGKETWQGFAMDREYLKYVIATQPTRSVLGSPSHRMSAHGVLLVPCRRATVCSAHALG